MEKQSCVITGHRPARFKFKYDESRKLCLKIKAALTEQIKAHYEQGVRWFYVGGAIGCDCWASEIILDLKRQETYRDMELFVAIPFPGQDERYDESQKRRYRRILRECSDSVTVCPSYQEGAYKKRDYFMVDSAQCVIAVYDNDKSVHSGTSMMINYAQKKGLSITLIHPDTSVVVSLAITGSI